MDSLPPHPSPTAMVVAAPARWWRKWWRGLSPTRQDRFAALAPLAAVLMFLAAIVAAFWYLRAEEAEREQEALRRDVEYAQQRVRLRLLERQEQLMRIARDLSNQELERTEFVSRAESLISQYPELQAITWIDERRRIRASHAAPTLASSELRIAGEVLKPGDTADTFGLAPRPAAAGVCPARRNLGRFHPAAPAASALEQPGQVQRRGAGGILHRQPAALRHADRSARALRRHAARWQEPGAGRNPPGTAQHGHTAPALVTPCQRIRGPRLPGGQRAGAQGTGLPHLAGRGGQRVVLAGGHAERDDGLDADRHLAPHPPPHAGPAGPGRRDELPPRDGELHPDGHACAGHGRPHHLCERRFLPDDWLERGRIGGPESTLPLLARLRPRSPARQAARRTVR